MEQLLKNVIDRHEERLPAVRFAGAEGKGARPAGSGRQTLLYRLRHVHTMEKRREPNASRLAPYNADMVFFGTELKDPG